MTDRELLSLAAKAAGITGLWVDAGLNTTGNAAPVIWNPLEDDGDALRLAVKLDICWRRFGNILEVCVPDHGYRRLFDEFIGDDKAIATRRAIVRAAAEIGKTTP